MYQFTFDAELYTPLAGDAAFLRVQESTWSRVLDALDAADVRVTCFTTGAFAKAYPDLFQRMVSAGHEIASHTMTHTPHNVLGDAGFEREVHESRAFLARESGQDVLGFRAPLGQLPGHFAAVLRAAGYRYDSSVAATHIRNHFQGLGTPKRPYETEGGDLRREAKGSGFWEVPVSVTPVVPIPCGGIFLSVVGVLARRIPKSRRPHHTMFLHPYDFIDLRSTRGAYWWDRVKPTGANWRLLDSYCREVRGQDMRVACNPPLRVPVDERRPHQPASPRPSA